MIVLLSLGREVSAALVLIIASSIPWTFNNERNVPHKYNQGQYRNVLIWQENNLFNLTPPLTFAANTMHFTTHEFNLDLVRSTWNEFKL